MLKKIALLMAQGLLALLPISLTLYFLVWLVKITESIHLIGFVTSHEGAKELFKDDIQCVIIDAVPCFTHLDLSVMAMLDDLNTIFRKRGVRLELAGRKRQLLAWFEKADIKSGSDGIYVHSDLYLALRINQSKQVTDEGKVTI